MPLYVNLDSNTTLVKVKLMIINSNTTLVKVKFASQRKNR